MELGYPQPRWCSQIEIRQSLRPLEPETDCTAFMRIGPGARFQDPYLEAARSAVMLDMAGSGLLARLGLFSGASKELAWRFSNLDALLQFHHPVGTEWLYCATRVLTGSHGYVGTQTQIWSDDGNLLATAASQLVCAPRMID